MQLWLDQFPTPVGTIRLVSDGTAVRAIDFENNEERLLRLLRIHWGPAVELLPAADPGGARSALLRYFDGEFEALSLVPVVTAGTPFQQKVWAALRDVPVGRTVSYTALARAAGFPDAVRAVGAANGANPVSIIVPCHRVIGANGKLTGYAGGLPRKQWLLAHERVRGQMTF